MSPWNFPIAIPCGGIAAALATGNTVILKPASETPLTALLVAQILEDAGVPPGVVNVLPTNSAGATVSAMLHDPRVRKISFTGSTPVGKHLASLAGQHMKRATMELGGHAPVLIYDDADIDLAVNVMAPTKLRNAGQVCIGFACSARF